MSILKVLSGGAAQGLVASVAPAFTAATGWSIDGTYGAVGLMATRLREGAACDVMISTAALTDELRREGLLTGSAFPLGRVETAVAVRERDPAPATGDSAQLRAALLAADEIHVPDVAASTAGIHVAKVLRELGVFDALGTRLKVHPNGATAMHALAASDAARAIGSTQSTEIIITKGLKLVGPLPPPHGLATMYSAAVTARAADRAVAQTLIDILVGRDQLTARQRVGFLETAGT